MPERDDRFDDLEPLWKEQPAAGPEPSSIELLMEVKQKAASFDRRIRRRDMLEIGAALILSAVFAYSALSTPGWLSKLGAVIACSCVGVVIHRLRSARTRLRDAHQDATLAERLSAELKKLDAQIELLRRVRSWYVAPVAIAVTVSMVTSAVPLGEVSMLTAGLVTGIGVALGALVFTLAGLFVWRINQRAVQEELIPYRRELERMLRDLPE